LTAQPPVVLYDACVLYPAPLRDFLIRLAVAGLVRAHWSPDIEEEWIRSVLRDRPDLTRAQLERTARLMEAAVPGALITDYEPIIEALQLPDPGDRHVLAAGIMMGVNVIVTFNVRDLPRDVVSRHGIEARRPDAFVLDLLLADPEGVAAVARAHRAALRNPPRSVDEYLATLSRTGLRRSAECLGDLGVEL
jgi:hypothetical protein